MMPNDELKAMPLSNWAAVSLGIGAAILFGAVFYYSWKFTVYVLIWLAKWWGYL